MTYDRTPPGLNWAEHYTMANMVYYAFLYAREPAKQTQAEPDPLPEDGTPARKHRGREPRTFKSIYVGVTTHNHRYVSPRTSGTTYPLNAAGERAAAVTRAIALGRDWIERRDGTQEELNNDT